jgi:hypothetical protein
MLCLQMWWGTGTRMLGRIEMGSAEGAFKSPTRSTRALGQDLLDFSVRYIDTLEIAAESE